MLKNVKQAHGGTFKANWNFDKYARAFAVKTNASSGAFIKTEVTFENNFI